MTGILSELLAAGLIDNIDGDDERITKMEMAAAALAKEYQKQPAELIRAILAGLDPDIPEDDPAIQKAMQALTHEWKSVSSIHTSIPVNLLRAILLEACSQVAEGENAAILWLTAADTLPMMHSGKEEGAIHKLIESLVRSSEEIAITTPKLLLKQRKRTLKTPEKEPLISIKVNRKALGSRIAAAAGPADPAYPELVDPNTAWPSTNGTWSYHFTKSFTKLFSSELDGLANKLVKFQVDQGIKQLEAINKEVSTQQLYIQATTDAIEAKQQAEQTRLNALWWAEALYSSSLRQGYREITPEVAAVVMAVDLINVVAKPTPASVGYLLSEAVNRMQDAGFDKEYELVELLNSLRKARNDIPKDWGDFLISPPEQGRLSLRDLLVLVLTAPEWNTADALGRAGLAQDISLSLPALAHAMFRQEQAVQLAQA